MRSQPGILFVLATGAVFGQTQAARPAFEVASIKPAAPIAKEQIGAGKLHIGMSIDGARVDIGNLSLTDLIRIAYRAKPYQVSGPDWMRSERFDVLAKIPDGVSKDQVPEMLQALLADRFHLAVHRETKEQPVYALAAGKNGPKVKESAPDAGDAAEAKGSDAGNAVLVERRDGNSKGLVVRGGNTGPLRIAPGPDGTLHLEAKQMTMAAFADFLAQFSDRPVVDQTGLKGTYEIGLDLSLDEMRRRAQGAGLIAPGLGANPGFGPGGEPGKGPGVENAPAAADPSGSTIFQSVQKLGLKLEPRKAPLEFIVVDHAEKAPTEN